MKKIESVFISLFVVGVIMKFFSIPFNGITIYAACLAGALTYLLFGFCIFNNMDLDKIFKENNYENVTARQILVAIIAGIVSCFSILGIMFVVLNWPFARMMIFFCSFPCLGMLVTSVIYMMKTNSNIHRQIVKRTLPLFLIVFVLLFIK